MTKSNMPVSSVALNQEIRKRLRKRAGTQEDLALEIGVNVNTLRSALTLNRYGLWLFDLCRRLGLPDSETELLAEFNFKLTTRPSTPMTPSIAEQMRVRVDRVKRALSDVDKDIGTFYEILGNKDLVALLTYSKIPEEWEGQFVHNAALLGIKGGYALYVVPSREIVEEIQKHAPALACSSVADYRAMHVWFMTLVDEELSRLRQTPDAVTAKLKRTGHAPVAGWEKIRASDYISFAVSRVALFMAPEHKYLLFRHDGESWTMAYYPLGRSTEESTRDVDLRHSFLPIGGADLVRSIRQVCRQAIRTTLHDHEQLNEQFHKNVHRIEAPELKTLEHCLWLLGGERLGD